MSKLAKKPIIIPDGVKVNYQNSRIVVEGKLGKLEQDVMSNYVDISVKENKLMIERKGESNPYRAFQGLYWSLFRNFVNGVSTGFAKTLVIQGLGYKWELKGKQLVINCGFSNPAKFDIPDDVKVNVESITQLTVSGYDKQRVGHVAAKIRDIKPPEPYKGKGIRYQNETVKLKEGKAAK